MTELTFLIKLLLEHELAEVTKQLVADRIREVEEWLTSKPVPPVAPLQVVNPSGVQQAPSTLALMAKHGIPDPAPVLIAQTPAAQAAMVSRQQAISESIAGKVDKLSGRPRKF